MNVTKNAPSVASTSPSKLTMTSKKAPDKTATSDFMNRFKGKMTTISKDGGVVGMINKES